MNKCVHTSNESDISDVYKVKENTLGWPRLIGTLQKVDYMTKSEQNLTVPVPLVYMDPSRSAKTGAVAVKLFISGPT